MEHDAYVRCDGRGEAAPSFGISATLYDVGWWGHRIGVFGGSAGGNLALSIVLKARDEGLTLPGAVVAISPWSDLTSTGDSYGTLCGKDPILHSYEAIEWCIHAYVDQVDLRHPLLSPVYADYRTGFPPTLVQTGTRDLFLSNCARLYRKMKNEGVSQCGVASTPQVVLSLEDSPLTRRAIAGRD